MATPVPLWSDSDAEGVRALATSPRAPHDPNQPARVMVDVTRVEAADEKPYKRGF